MTMTTIVEHTFPGGAILALVQGDLTTSDLDAIDRKSTRLNSSHLA